MAAANNAVSLLDDGLSFVSPGPEPPKRRAGENIAYTVNIDY